MKSGDIISIMAAIIYSGMNVGDHVCYKDEAIEKARYIYEKTKIVIKEPQ